MNNWSLPQCQHLPFLPTGTRSQADVLFFCHFSALSHCCRRAELTAPGGPAHLPATKPPPLSKWRPEGDGGFTPIENYVTWPPFLKRALVMVCPAASASAEGEPSHLGMWGNGHQPRTAPNVILKGCGAWGPGGFQQCRNLNDPPCFHIRTKIRRNTVQKTLDTINFTF